MKRLVIFFTACLFMQISNSYAQTGSDFNSNHEWINNTIKEVVINSERFEQKIELLDSELLKVKFFTLKTDSKGKTSEEAFDFYLSDTDENTVKMEVKGKVLSVLFDTKNQQKLIKKFSNGELQGYVSTIKILVGEIDAAKDLVNVLEKIIPASRKEKQTWRGLPEVLKWFNTNITDVSVDGYEYKQTFENNQEKPYLIKYTFIKVDSKGNTSEEVYEFNFSDINKNLSEFKVSGKTLSVILLTKNKQNLIQYHKNGELQNYTSSITIYVDDVELARNIILATEFAVPLCKSEFTTFQSPDEALTWLNKNIGEVSIANSSYKQEFVFSSEEAGIITFTSIKTDSKGKSIKQVYEFYLPDINENAVDFNISGKTLSIKLSTKNKEKVIRNYKDDVLQNYILAFDIYADEIEEAREIINTIKYAIPLKNKGIKTWNDLSDALNWLKTNIRDASKGSSKIEQDFESVPAKSNKNVFITEEDDSKGNTTRNVYEYYLSDISSTSINLKVLGKSLIVNFTTNSKNKHIRHSKNDMLQNFMYSINIYVDDVLEARNIMEALKFAIPLSEDANQMWGDQNSTMNWVKNAVSRVNAGTASYDQTIEFEEGNLCRVKYTSVKIDTKGNETEEIFEFNLSDINKSLSGFSVSGKIIELVLAAKNKQKLVKCYKNGELQNYAYQLKIVMGDIREAKNLVLALNELVTKCQ